MANSIGHAIILTFHHSTLWIIPCCECLETVQSIEKAETPAVLKVHLGSQAWSLGLIATRPFPVARYPQMSSQPVKHVCVKGDGVGTASAEHAWQRTQPKLELVP